MRRTDFTSSLIVKTVAEIQFGRWRGKVSRISDKFVLIFCSFLFFNEYGQAQNGRNDLLIISDK